VYKQESHKLQLRSQEDYKDLATTELHRITPPEIPHHGERR